MKSLLHERQQRLMLKWLGKKWQVSPAYAVSGQIMVDIAGHEDDSQIFSYADRADGQFVAVHVGKLIGARGQLKARRGEDEVCEQEVNGTFILRADFEGL